MDTESAPRSICASATETTRAVTAVREFANSELPTSIPPRFDMNDNFAPRVKKITHAPNYIHVHSNREISMEVEQSPMPTTLSSRTLPPILTEPVRSSPTCVIPT